jgi:MraZ protein
MNRFVSTVINKLDAKGRVSVPAGFRDVLARDAYGGGSAQREVGGSAASTDGSAIYCYPSLDAPALDAGGEGLAKKIDALLDGLNDYSDERDQLSVALYGDVHLLKIDGDGRIVLPEALRQHMGLSTTGAAEVAFVGLGQKFQMWEPTRFDAFRAQAREKVRDHRKLLHARGGSGDTNAS